MNKPAFKYIRTSSSLSSIELREILSYTPTHEFEIVEIPYLTYNFLRQAEEFLTVDLSDVRLVQDDYSLFTFTGGTVGDEEQKAFLQGYLQHMLSDTEKMDTKQLRALLVATTTPAVRVTPQKRNKPVYEFTPEQYEQVLDNAHTALKEGKYPTVNRETTNEDEHPISLATPSNITISRGIARAVWRDFFGADIPARSIWKLNEGDFQGNMLKKLEKRTPHKAPESAKP